MEVLRVGAHGDAVRKLQGALVYLGYSPGAVDGVFGSRVEDAVEQFQRDHGLYADGVVGLMTLGVLDPLVPPNLKSGYTPDPTDPTPVPSVTLLKWVPCPADVFPGRDGYHTTVLREDTAFAYAKLYQTVHTLGGIITSSGGKRDLLEPSNPNRSRTSMHYTGRAFDMAVPTGLADPAVDPFILEQVQGTRYWTVWCRSSLTSGELASQCISLDVMSGVRSGTLPLTGTYLLGGKVRTKQVIANAFDFTALAAKFGFHRITGRKAFWDAGDLGAAEWWHMQWEDGLVKGQSKFGDEILKVYSPADAKRFVYWNEAKNAVFGVSWF